MRRNRWAVPLLLYFLTLSVAVPARTWFTVAEKGDAKLEAEVRAMAWLVSAEQGSVFDQDKRINDFVVRRFRLVLRGHESKAWSFGLQMGQDNLGGRVLTDDGNLRVKEAFVGYRAHESFQLIVGQFKVPFLRHNLESGFNQLLIDRAALPGLRPAREGSRDIGLMVWGNDAGLQYRIAVFDGADQELKNSRSSLRFTGRLSYNWFTSEADLGYTGTTLGKKRVLQLAADIDVQHDRLDTRDDRDFAGLSRDYREVAAAVR